MITVAKALPRKRCEVAALRSLTPACLPLFRSEAVEPTNRCGRRFGGRCLAPSRAPGDDGPDRNRVPRRTCRAYPVGRLGRIARSAEDGPQARCTSLLAVSGGDFAHPAPTVS